MNSAIVSKGKLFRSLLSAISVWVSSCPFEELHKVLERCFQKFLPGAIKLVMWFGHRAKIMVVVYQMDLDADNFGFSDRPFTCCSFHLFTAAIMPLVRNYT